VAKKTVKTTGKRAKTRTATRTAKRAISAAVHSRRDSLGVSRSVTALCDAELLGSVLKGGDCVIDLKRYEEFYRGELVNEDEAAALAAQANSLNVVGEKSLAAARRAFEISEKNVKRVAGVPHAQVYRI
jgi:hypothetical protein